MALTPEQTETLVNTVLHGPTAQQASALFELIKAVSDPKGNKRKFDCAIDALRAIGPQTLEYEAWFDQQVTRPVRASFSSSVAA